MGVTVGGRRALLSVPLGYTSLHSEQGPPVPLAMIFNCLVFDGNHCSDLGGS